MKTDQDIIRKESMMKNAIEIVEIIGRLESGESVYYSQSTGRLLVEKDFFCLVEYDPGRTGGNQSLAKLKQEES